jgi:hypothetical protein
MSTLNLKDARLRANPAYELVLYDRLSEAGKQALRSLADDPGCYGILRPREDPALSMKSVSQDVALLLFSLRSAGTLPRFAAEALRDECDQVIGRMILDGILEIELDGEMVSGPAAYSALARPANDCEAEGPLAAMSRRAIDYAAALELTDPMALSARLYRYNTIPASRRWRALLPDDAATEAYLGLGDGPAVHALAGEWLRLPESHGWISWRSKSTANHRPAQAQHGGAESTYKLYVSPAPGRLREAVQATAGAVARSNAMQFKVGKDIHGLLRPDKMVVYFRHFSDLQEVALKIMASLEGCPPHGVPFTAELAGRGLLSWGVDPPANENGFWSGPESWRVKICKRLALALIQSGSVAEVSPAGFALERLRLEGIDTTTWTPSLGLAWSN